MRKESGRPALDEALVSRVTRRVAGQAIPRSVVRETVARVLDAMEAQPDRAGNDSFLVAVTARSLPDLASRLRRDLDREGAVILDIGIGSAGQHTVVTLRLEESARPVLEQVAERSRYALSYLNGVA